MLVRGLADVVGESGRDQGSARARPMVETRIGLVVEKGPAARFGRRTSLRSWDCRRRRRRARRACSRAIETQKPGQTVGEIRRPVEGIDDPAEFGPGQGF